MIVNVKDLGHGKVRLVASDSGLFVQLFIIVCDEEATQNSDVLVSVRVLFKEASPSPCSRNVLHISTREERLCRSMATQARR